MQHPFAFPISRRKIAHDSFSFSITSPPQPCWQALPRHRRIAHLRSNPREGLRHNSPMIARSSPRLNSRLPLSQWTGQVKVDGRSIRFSSSKAKGGQLDHHQVFAACASCADQHITVSPADSKRWSQLSGGWGKIRRRGPWNAVNAGGNICGSTWT